MVSSLLVDIKGCADVFFEDENAGKAA